jgi:predicted Zn-dependent peptidase
VTGNGGTNNANTSDDRTYYYVFPSNNLELGLWMEAERMLHPYNQIGVDTQNEVVKEDYVLTTLLTDKFSASKEKHIQKPSVPLDNSGSMDHLDAATLEEFQAFNKKILHA